MKFIVNCLYCKSVLNYKVTTRQFANAYQYTCRCVSIGTDNGFTKTLDSHNKTLSLQIYWPDVTAYFYRLLGPTKHNKFLANITVLNIYDGQYLPPFIAKPSHEVATQCPKDVDLFTIETARQFVDTVLLMS